MSKKITLDVLDRRIIDLLQNDGSLSASDVADKLGMTPPPCWRRIKRLKDEGILKTPVWKVDPAKVGLDFIIFAMVKLANHDREATTRFRDEVNSIAEVLECYILLGSPDAMLKIVVPDIRYYEHLFYNRISQVPGVREVTSFIVVTEVKNSSALPLEIMD